MEKHKKNRIQIGDKVKLHFEEASSIGYNGIICKVKMKTKKNSEELYFCESIYGTAKIWAKEENLIKQK